MLNIVGYRLPNCRYEAGKKSSSKSLCYHKLLNCFKLCKEEKEKEMVFTRNPHSINLLDDLTPNDVRHLIESEDEYSRRGKFIRIFPSITSSDYLQFAYNLNYYDHLLNAWEKRYSTNRTEGKFRLKSYFSKFFTFFKFQGSNCFKITVIKEFIGWVKSVIHF